MKALKKKCFKKIVVPEPVFLTSEGIEEIKNLCEEFVWFDTPCASEQEMTARICNADCIITSYKTEISKNSIENCPHLKHVALCCSYYGKQYAKVNISALEERNISFSYLVGYGDNGVVEYTLHQVISLLQGLNGKSWKKDAHDLTSVKLGILGMGELGSRIARVFKMLECNVYYYSRTRKANIESEGITYLELEELLKAVDILSINLNRNTCLIGGNMLEIFGDNKIIINTSIGYCYELGTLKKWLENKNNLYICDKSAANDDIKELLQNENVIYTDLIVGATKECYGRATSQVIKSLKEKLKSL